tara:strand:- start:52 stop:582 length:531 start_codon:yes stop_codon:yes gene_type:complete
MSYLNQIEIEIKKEKTHFIATCAHFPLCKGKGETKEAAIDKLADSIARLLSKLTRQTIKSTLNQKNFTHILLSQDAAKNRQTEKRVYSFGLEPIQKKLSIKLAPYNGIRDMVETKEMQEERESKELVDSLDDDYYELNQMEVLQENPVDKMISLFDKVKNTSSEEGFMFGFPISFN